MRMRISVALLALQQLGTHLISGVCIWPVLQYMVQVHHLISQNHVPNILRE